MNSNILRFFIIKIFTICTIFTTRSQGVNLTGLEKTWQSQKSFNYRYYKENVLELKSHDFKHVRLPVDLDYFLNDADKREKYKFKRLIKRLVKLTANAHMSLIISNFNHGLNLENYTEESDRISKNWIALLNMLSENEIAVDHIYLDIVNEPILYPKEWEVSALKIIRAIREVHPNIVVIYGASNYNSIYELSRIEPLPVDNIIYSFHFYEPFVFTHQGTSWTGDQNATLGIPFPYPDSTATIKMPQLAAKAMNTAGEVNYKDYDKTGTYQAISDKLTWVKNWKERNKVEVWCTEYGVTKNADEPSRLHYLNAVNQVLRDYNIRGYVWEYKGNFGVKEFIIKKQIH